MRVEKCSWMFLFFFFNDTATTEIYTLSLHDALPISVRTPTAAQGHAPAQRPGVGALQRKIQGRLRRIDPGDPKAERQADRKSTRLNSSHANISYAVFCLKKKKHLTTHTFIRTHPSKT